MIKSIRDTMQSPSSCIEAIRARQNLLYNNVSIGIKTQMSEDDLKQALQSIDAHYQMKDCTAVPYQNRQAEKYTINTPGRMASTLLTIGLDRETIDLITPSQLLLYEAISYTILMNHRIAFEENLSTQAPSDESFMESLQTYHQQIAENLYPQLKAEITEHHIQALTHEITVMLKSPNLSTHAQQIHHRLDDIKKSDLDDQDKIAILQKTKQALVISELKGQLQEAKAIGPDVDLIIKAPYRPTQ